MDDHGSARVIRLEGLEIAMHIPVIAYASKASSCTGLDHKINHR